MAFSDLATETIISILHESIPESFKDLALTCKRVYGASTIFIDEYNSLRKKYRQISWSSSTAYPETALQLLFDIANKPIIARYIEHADLQHEFGRQYSYPYVTAPTTVTADQAATVRDVLSTFIKQSGSLGQISEKLWARRITMESRHYQPYKPFSTVLLLSLLSNVRSLALPETWNPLASDEEELLSALIVCTQNANNESMPDAGLSRLTTLIDTRKIDFFVASQLQASVPFLALNSLREFYCTGLTANKSIIHQQLELAYPNLGRNLERFELGGCSLDHDEFVEYLSCMPALKVFKFSFAIKEHEGVWAWNPARFVSAIEKSHGHRLEELSVSILGDGCRELLGTGIKSMKGFEKLKVLELDTRLLLGRRFNDPDQDYPRPKRALAPCTDIQLPTLVDLLPSSIGTLHLMIDSTNGRACMERLVAGFKDKKSSLLPNLSYISIRCHLGNKQARPTAEEASDLAHKTRVWVGPILQALGSVETEYSENFALTYYDTEYSEARFMHHLRKMLPVN